MRIGLTLRGGLLIAALGLVFEPGGAQAGGFSVREQSTEFQGMSFAGNGAAGGGLSGMFWNPAVAAYAPVGIYSESHYAAIIANSEITGNVLNAGASPAPIGTNLGALSGLRSDSGDIAKDAIVPSSYMSYRINDRLVAAISVNSPFGLVTEPSNRLWAGQTFARTSEIKTYNFSPTLAYRVTPTLAVGVGVQIEHIEGRLKNASGLTPPGSNTNTYIQGDDTAFGFTAGLNWNPSRATSIGLGYRSSIDHTLEGTAFTLHPTFGPLNGAIKAGVTLPEIVTLSLRQELSPQWRVLGTIEYSHWDRVQKLDIVCANNVGPASLCPSNGGLVRSLDLGWHDGWFFALGAEHDYSERLRLRAGIAYELSPVQNPDERSLRVPDADRFWASIGATYKWSEKIALDFAYTHIFSVGDTDIDRTENGLRFIGSADSNIDIVSASLKIKLGNDAHGAPLK